MAQKMAINSSEVAEVAEVELTKNQKKKIDRIVKNFPLFLTTVSDDLCEYVMRYPKDFVYHYDLPDKEFEYKSHLVEGQVCIVFMPKLIELLRSLNISEEKLHEIMEEFHQATNPTEPPESELVQVLKKVGNTVTPTETTKN